MKKEEKRLIEIIRDVLAGKNKSEWSMQISKEEIERVIKCARVHGVLPFLQECPVFMEEPYREKLFFYLKDYAYKDAQQAYAAETLFELFEKNGIYCMPLKGIRTKQFYPYPEFRTMGDLDILYKEDQTKKLKQVMQDAGYKFGGYNIKHDEYEKDGVTIEMHRDVLFRLTNAYDYFADIWERAIHAKGKQYIYEMSLEDHYLHSVCHLAEHFVRGGIGIRMVLEGRGIQATLVLKNTAEHHQETVTYLGQQGWDFAFGGEIGEEKDAYIEMLKSTVKQYEESTGKIAGAYFFNGKEYGRGSKILYPNFKEMDFKIGVAFAKDASSLKHGKNTDYNMEIEECQNISMREDMETIENILDQVIEARSVVVLSDFSLERQMEIAGEASLEHFEEILDLLLQKQSESDLVVGSVTCYEGTLEDRANRIEQRRQKYSEYEQKCLEEIEQLTKQRDEALEKQEVKK